MSNSLDQDKVAIASAQAYSANRAARLQAEIGLVTLNAQYETDIQKYLNDIGGIDGREGYFEPSEWVLGDVLERQNIRI